MSIECVRRITFIIPGTPEVPDVRVIATEVDGGAISFEVDVLNTVNLTSELRALFFDFNDDDKLTGLKGSGLEVTSFDTVDVINLGRGVNMHGAASPFDVGLAFGEPGVGQDNTPAVSFLLTNSGNNLTLDDIAQVRFGARLTSDGAKLVATAPAAPDAEDDTYSIFEDGRADLDSPSHAPIGTVFPVLGNDTDADGDTLTITHVLNVMHGTVEIVDGPDADSLPGDAILYTPDADYSGDDNFKYVISDNNGGTDFASVDVSITSVADIPTLSYEVIAGNNDNEVVVMVTTEQTDADSSEFIDRIELSGIPLTGVAVDPNGYNPIEKPDLIKKEFQFTLPLGETSGFNLGITTVSKETSNGDEETAFQTLGLLTDTQSIFEDGQDGLEDPSQFPEATVFEAPASTTDPTSGTRTISIIRDVAHGSIQIVDGADADSDAGDAISYTPDQDYSGTDSYSYTISDGNGNTDFIMTSISIDAVADIPSLQLEASAVAGSANQIRIHATASTTDLDGSEFIDRLYAETLPAGVTLELESNDNFYDAITRVYDPNSTAGSLERDFILTLPLGQNQDFSLKFTAVAKENDFAGDEQESSFELPISFESQSITENIEFSASQNLWGLGPEQSFDLDVPFYIFGADQFIPGLLPAIDLELDKSIIGGLVDIDGNIFLETGFNFNFSLKGGSIDAASIYSIGLTTNYNATTDTVLVSSSEDLLSSSFDTTFPFLTFGLDFIYDIQADLKIELDGGVLGSETLNVFNNIDESDTLTVLPETNVSEILDLAVFAYPNPLNITPPPPAPQIPVPNPAAGPFFIRVDWPEIDISAGPVDNNVVVGAGESEIILGLEVDVDKLVFPPLGLGFEVSKLGFGVEASLLDFDVEGGLSLNQEHTLTLADVFTGNLLLEDGTQIPYTIGQDEIIDDFLSYDANGDGDVGIKFEGRPLATFNNDTDLGLTFLYTIQALFAKVSGGILGSGSVSVLDKTESITPVDFDLFDDTFDLAFEDMDTQSILV